MHLGHVIDGVNRAKNDGFFSGKTALRTNTQNYDEADEFLERRSASMWPSQSYLRSVSIVLGTKLPSYDPNAFQRVRLPSSDAKSMLNVATILKTATKRASRFFHKNVCQN